MAVFQSFGSSSRQTLFALTTLVLLSACAGTGQRGGNQRISSAEADQAYQDGRYLIAARAYASNSKRQAGDRDHWLVRAADAAYRAGDPQLTRNYLASVDTRQLDNSLRSLAALLNAVTAELPAHRILILLDVTDASIPTDYRALLLTTRATAFLDAGQPYRSALERVALSPWLVGKDVQQTNREAILSALRKLTASQAAEYLSRHRPDEEIYGWLSLVEQLKSQVFSGQPASTVIANWRSRFPQHPFNRDSVNALLDDYDLSFVQPGRIALLLPLSNDRLARPARAVRDGFLSAYYADPQHHSEVVVLDTAGDPQQALIRLRQAIAEGATQIVGPLHRDAVTAVLLEADGRVPILALNYQEGSAPTVDGVLQFGLQPEEEARIAAEKMLEDGHWRAVSLTPLTDWGARMENAFAVHYEQLGGRVLGRYRYNEAEVDYGAVIQQVVGVTEARLRERQLQRVIGQPLSFDPLPRHDTDAIFVAARPRQARQIKPQLAFYNAGSLPTYATSHAYSGRQDPDADRDLNGMHFCDAPWLLGTQSFQPSLQSVREVFPDAQGSTVRLFAVGIDAYRMLPYLGWLSRYRNDSFPGVTGQLSVDSRERVRRQLDCAVFRKGVAVYQAGPLIDEDDSG